MSLKRTCAVLLLIMALCGAVRAEEAEYKILPTGLNTDRPLGVQQCEPVDYSWFDDVLFVGDSVTEKFQRYTITQRRTNAGFLGKALFFSAPSFGIRTALEAVSNVSKHPSLNGKKMTVEKAVVASKCRKVYIMLGMNDASKGAQESVSYMLKLIWRIREAAPDVMIVLQSATPRMTGTRPTNRELFAYDVALYEATKEMENVYFVDVAYAMRDDDGTLRELLCADTGTMTLHLNDRGCLVWTEWLRCHIPGMDEEPEEPEETAEPVQTEETLTETENATNETEQ